MSGRARGHALAALGFLTLSLATFGWPLADHPGRAILGRGRDPQIFVWAFAWWPHALLTWQNPFVSHAIFAPDGIDLAWTTTVPALALAFAPLTLLAGPVASFNAAEILMPALSAWCAYLFCWTLTRSRLAALVGGYLYGFSAYVLAEELGHLHLTAVFCLPLLARALVRFVRGELDRRGLAWRVGVLLALQLWISTEVLFTSTLALVLALALALALLPERRRRLRAALAPLAWGYGLAALLSAPLLYYALSDFERGSINQPALFDGDLLNLVVPTSLTAIGGPNFQWVTSHFPANEPEQGAYIGIPVLVLVAWYALRERRARSTWFLLALLGASVLATLGTELVVDGRPLVRLPWAELANAPLFDNVLPVRLALFSSLATSAAVALWVAGSRGLPRALLPALAVASVAPAAWHAYWKSIPERWPFFTQAQYATCFARGETIAVFPYGFWGNSMLWQAESGFYFRLAEGYLRPKPPPSYLADPAVLELTYTTGHPSMRELLAFVRDKKVDRIVSVIVYAYPNSNQMHRFGALQALGGVFVAPACGYPSLQRGVHPTPLHPPGFRAGSPPTSASPPRSAVADPPR